MSIPKTLKNFAVFVDGRGYLGKAEEATLPKLALKTEEYRGGGMAAPVEIDMGLEKMEASVTFAEYDPDLFALFGLEDGSKAAMTLRGAMKDNSGTTERIVNLRGLVKELDSGNWKAGEKGTLKLTMAVRYYKDTIGGREVAEVDAENMIRRIDGKDQLAETRSALGM